MSGKAQGGFDNATANLFADRPWIVCAEGREPEAVARVQALVRCLGARLITMTPEAHDEKVALVSHALQLLASWLQVTGVERQALAVAGPAFDNMTRTAGGSPAIWRDIFETNADKIGSVLREGARALTEMADALLAEPPQLEQVLSLLEQAKRSQDSGPGGQGP
jgi:prephenate dehydrogenase